MSKRWFDLLATIIFAVLIFIINVFKENFWVGNQELYGILIACVVFVWGLRRFFYNKEK